jgi:hypothetical protein
MPVLKRRSKMVSFRLSEQEYQDLVALCVSRDVRSLSDLARDAMNSLLGTPKRNGNGNGNGDGIESAVAELHGRMAELDRELKRLTRFIQEQEKIS